MSVLSAVCVYPRIRSFALSICRERNRIPLPYAPTRPLGPSFTQLRQIRTKADSPKINAAIVEAAVAIDV